MYKVSIARLKALKEALEKSNEVIRESVNAKVTLELLNTNLAVIKANEEQIKILEEQFYIE